MIGAKITVAKYWAELKIDTAVPLSCAGNQAATIRLFERRSPPQSLLSLAYPQIEYPSQN